MEGAIVALVVVIAVILVAGVAYFLYFDMKKRKEVLRARAAEAAEERAVPRTEDEAREFLRDDTEKRRQNTVRINLAACEFPEPEDVDLIISDLKITRLRIQNLTAQKLEQEAIKDLKVVMEAAKRRESLLKGEPSEGK